MTESETVLLCRFYHPWEAEIVRGVLETAGLPCAISPGRMLDMGDVAPHAGYRVLVRASYLERAKQALDAAQQAGKKLPSN